MSIEEAYMIDRINRIYTGVDAPIWISCENFDRIPHVKAEADMAQPHIYGERGEVKATR